MRFHIYGWKEDLAKFNEMQSEMQSEDGATCGQFLALELVPDNEDSGDEEEDPAQHLHTRVGEQGVLHGRVLDLKHKK